MSGKVVLTVGAVLRGDDAAGPLLAKMLQDDPVEGWDVIDGGQVPEDFTGDVRRAQPDLMLMVDAADMGLPAGTIRRLSAEDVAEDFMMTTHTLPLSFLMNELDECCGEIIFLGIQPAQMEFFTALTPAVADAVDWIYARLKEGADLSVVPYVGDEGA